jgi:glycosyltransferase involved in cell wall biosynthesis
MGPFEWNHQAFGGTEYMAKNFRELILPSVPKFNDYVSIIIPGLMPNFRAIHTSPIDAIVWMHNTPAQFGEAELDSLRNPKFLNKVKYFVTVSKFAKSEIVSQLEIEPERVYVIPNAIHPLKFDPDKFNTAGPIKLINTSSPDRGIDVLFNAIPLIDEDIEIYKKDPSRL